CCILTEGGDVSLLPSSPHIGDGFDHERENTLLMGDEDSSTIPAREADQFIESGVDDLVLIPKESEKTSRMMILSEFEDISSLDPIKFTLVIDEPPLLVITPPASKQFSLREVDRFDPFFSLTQSGGMTRVMETPSFGFYHMPSPRPAAYSPKELNSLPSTVIEDSSFIIQFRSRSIVTVHVDVDS
nr:NAC domain-containing protein [Tanacetum cinerariifolium]